MRIVTLLAVGFLVLMPSLASADDTLVKFGSGAASTTMGSYSLGDVLIQSAVGQNKTTFIRLSLWNFREGWFEPWIPPPNGELRLERGGWVNTFSGFFSRELDPTFTFNAGTSGTRDGFPERLCEWSVVPSPPEDGVAPRRELSTVVRLVACPEVDRGFHPLRAAPHFISTAATGSRPGPRLDARFGKGLQGTLSNPPTSDAGSLMS
jgi:hypothetical protein